jgi:hypothetical protein
MVDQASHQSAQDLLQSLQLDLQIFIFAIFAVNGLNVSHIFNFAVVSALKLSLICLDLLSEVFSLILDIANTCLDFLFVLTSLLINVLLKFFVVGIERPERFFLATARSSPE